jgi:hypothetical protein
MRNYNEGAKLRYGHETMCQRLAHISSPPYRCLKIDLSSLQQKAESLERYLQSIPTREEFEVRGHGQKDSLPL